MFVPGFVAVELPAAEALVLLTDSHLATAGGVAVLAGVLAHQSLLPLQDDDDESLLELDESELLQSLL